MSTSIAPAFLIAVPQLLDPNFRQSVVLLLQQSDEGALGLVINRESGLRLQDCVAITRFLTAARRTSECGSGARCSPSRASCSTAPSVQDPEGRPIVDGLLLSASTGNAVAPVPRDGGRFHCYAGYAGWAPGQLEREIADGSWIVTAPDPILVFDHPAENVWARALTDNGIDPVGAGARRVRRQLSPCPSTAVRAGRLRVARASRGRYSSIT